MRFAALLLLIFTLRQPCEAGPYNAYTGALDLSLRLVVSTLGYELRSELFEHLDEVPGKLLKIAPGQEWSSWRNGIEHHLRLMAADDFELDLKARQLGFPNYFGMVMHFVMKPGTPDMYDELIQPKISNDHWIADHPEFVENLDRMIESGVQYNKAAKELNFTGKFDEFLIFTAWDWPHLLPNDQKVHRLVSHLDGTLASAVKFSECNEIVANRLRQRKR